jgi:hypothetical protein
MMMDKITERLNQSLLPQRLAPYWCSVCGRLVTMISVEEAAMISKLSAEAIHHKMENRSLHSIRTSSGAHFICLASLTSKMMKAF